jgi:hypothetical protein
MGRRRKVRSRDDRSVGLHSDMTFIKYSDVLIVGFITHCSVRGLLHRTQRSMLLWLHINWLDNGRNVSKPPCRKLLIPRLTARLCA